MSDGPAQESEALRAELASILEDTRRHLEWLGDAGVTQLPAATHESARAPARPAPPPPPAPANGGVVRPAFLSPAKEAPKPPPPPAPTPPQPPPAPVAAPPPPAPMTAAPPPAPSRDEQLRTVRADIGDCRRCKLCEGRNAIVFGQGHPFAEVMFVGEGPGEDEDNTGLAFVGRAGQLLTKMIDGMGYTRDDVYICNIVKCRPPENRNPEPDEMEACRQFVERQIRIVKPKVIVALGKVAASALLRREVAISRERGQWAEFEGIPVMPTFHPSYLLRSPEQKKPAWMDLKAVLARIGRTAPMPKKG